MRRKRLIGYPIIFDWLVAKDQSKLKEVIEDIQQKTRAYAKRQIVFGKRLKKQLDCNGVPVTVIEN